MSAVTYDVNVSTRRYAPGTEMPWHSDGRDHFSLIVQGSLIEKSEDQIHFATVGSLVRKPTSTRHETQIGPEGAVILVLSGPSSVGINYDWVLSQQSTRLLPLFAMRAHQMQVDIPVFRAKTLSPFAQRADQLLKDHPELSLVQLAEYVGTNATYLSALIHREFGEPFCQRRTAFRLAKAANRIAQGLSIGQAAHEAHFADQAHLSRVFRSSFCMTPREYQQAILAIS